MSIHNETAEANVRPVTDPSARDRRRFLKLRRMTDVMLEEVRRLNGLTVAAREGISDFDTTEDEVQRIESRLHLLVDELRRVAGVESTIPGKQPSSVPPAAIG